MLTLPSGRETYIKDDVLNKKISYWKEKLQGVSHYRFLLIFARPAVQSTKGASVSFYSRQRATGKFTS
jgi:hypothetical protein